MAGAAHLVFTILIIAAQPPLLLLLLLCSGSKFYFHPLLRLSFCSCLRLCITRF